MLDKKNSRRSGCFLTLNLFSSAPWKVSILGGDEENISLPKTFDVTVTIIGTALDFLLNILREYFWKVTTSCPGRIYVSGTISPGGGRHQHTSGPKGKLGEIKHLLTTYEGVNTVFYIFRVIPRAN